MLHGHSVRPLHEDQDTTPCVRGEEAVLAATEHLTWTPTQDKAGREGPASLLLLSAQWTSIFLCTTRLHSLYFVPYPSRLVPSSGGVPNGGFPNPELPSPLPRHAGWRSKPRTGQNRDYSPNSLKGTLPSFIIIMSWFIKFLCS